MRRKIALSTLVTLVSTAAMLIAPTSALAQSFPTGTGWVCDNAAASSTCLSANAVNGALVYTKTEQNIAEEATNIGPVDLCGGTDQVDGNGTNCPFANGSGMNTKYQGDYIASLFRVSGVTQYIFYSDGQDVKQNTNPTSGLNWVLAPVNPGSNDGLYYLVSITESNGGTSYFACSNGANQAVLVTSVFQGGGTCEWSLPPVPQ